MLPTPEVLSEAKKDSRVMSQPVLPALHPAALVEVSLPLPCSNKKEKSFLGLLPCLTSSLQVDHCYFMALVDPVLLKLSM